MLKKILIVLTSKLFSSSLALFAATQINEIEKKQIKSKRTFCSRELCPKLVPELYTVYRHTPFPGRWTDGVRDS